MIQSILGCLLWLTLTVGLCCLMNRQRSYRQGRKDGYDAAYRGAAERLRKTHRNTSIRL